MKLIDYSSSNDMFTNVSSCYIGQKFWKIFIKWRTIKLRVKTAVATGWLTSWNQVKLLKPTMWQNIFPTPCSFYLCKLHNHALNILNCIQRYRVIFYQSGKLYSMTLLKRTSGFFMVVHMVDYFNIACDCMQVHLSLGQHPFFAPYSAVSTLKSETINFKSQGL